MKVFISHSRNFDFKNQLYAPIKASKLSQVHSFFLPHETDDFVNTKDIIKSSDIVIAEVSYPSTGQGIELGWASVFGIDIACIHIDTSTPSGSIQAVTSKILPYSNSTPIIDVIGSILV